MRNGFWGCSFCGGRGCLACPKESDKAYKKAFPDGPKPILTVPIYNAPGDADGQSVMADEGCPNAESPQVIHPEDAQRLNAVLGARVDLAGALAKLLASARTSK